MTKHRDIELACINIDVTHTCAVPRGLLATLDLHGNTVEMHSRSARSMATYLFTTLDDSERLHALDTVAVQRAIADHDQILNAAFDAHGGHVFATFDGGLGVAFANCQNALVAAVVAQRSLIGHSWPFGIELQVRMGLHVSDAPMESHDYFGPAVSTASIVANAAHADQILATASTIEAAGPIVDIGFEDRGQVRLKGLANACHLFQVIGLGLPQSFPELTPPVDAGHSPARPSGMRQDERVLLERDHEMHILESAVFDASRSLGSITFIAGGAGAGKTSLVAEAIGRLQPDEFSVLVGFCDPLSTPRPFGPLIDMASLPGSPLQHASSPAADAMDTIAFVYAKLRSAVLPTVLLFEDLHWADQPTLDLLRFVGRRLGSLPVAIFCTYRDDEVGLDHPLRALLGELAARAELHRLELQPLSIRAVIELLGESHLNPHELLKSTGGNPFFLTEVIAANSSLPETVRDAVLGRFLRLSPRVQRVVEAVAIAPRSIAYGLLSDLVEVSVDDIDDAVSAGLLILDGDSLRFRHELARRAVEDSASALRNQVSHRKMVESLRRHKSADLARLAHHAAASNDRELVLDIIPAAAAGAAAYGSHKQAAQLLEIAIDYVGDYDDQRAVMLRVELARHLHISGTPPADILALSNVALQRARRLGDPLLIAATLSAQSSFHCSVPDPATARRAIDEAVELLQDLPPSNELAVALHRSSLIHMLTRLHEPSMRDAERCRAVAKELGEEELIKLADAQIATTEMATGDAVLAAAALRAAADDAERRGARTERSHYLGMLSTGCGERRHYDLAIAALHEGIALDRERDADGSADYMTAWLARVHFEQGRWEQAAALASPVLASATNPHGSTATTAAGVIGRVRVRRGDPNGADMLSQAQESRNQQFLQYLWSPACGLAEYHWLRGDETAAVSAVSALYERALTCDSYWARGELAFWMWRCSAIDRPPDRCAEPFRLQMVGDWHAAADVWHGIGCPYERALALADGPASAKRESVQVLDALGASPAAAYVRRLLRGEGEVDIPRGPVSTTKRNPGQLTNRQLEVLVLIAEGHTNGEIAARLFISKKTVEHHISAVFSKLGITSRTAAVAKGRKLGVIAD